MNDSALVAPNAVPVLAGRQGVLLLEDIYDPCETPERHEPGTPAAFYDARTQAITRVAADVQLRQFAVVSLAEGRVMVAGGREPSDSFSKPTRRTRIWDPQTRGWTEGAPMIVARSKPFITTLSDGRVMAAGGSVAVGEPECPDCETDTNTSELYDPTTGRWRPTSTVRLVTPDGGEADELAGITALSGGQVLARGGNDSAALFDPISEVWTSFAWRRGWVGPFALPDGTALSFGIEFSATDPDFEVPFATRFDPNGTTSIVGHLEPTDSSATAVLGDGRLFFAGGVVEDQTGYLGVFVPTAEVFDPRTGLLSELASMPAKRGAARAVPLDDGSVLLVGGIDVAETQPATDDQSGNDTPGCVPVKQRAIRWSP